MRRFGIFESRQEPNLHRTDFPSGARLFITPEAAAAVLGPGGARQMDCNHLFQN